MKSVKKIVAAILMIACLFIFAGCEVTASSNTYADMSSTMQVAGTLAQNQPTPTDIQYSLERYNLIRRAYWVNGMEEKARTLPCAIEKPLSYIVLFAGNAPVGSFVIDGKATSLNSYLTPDSEYYELAYGGEYTRENDWLADVDGTYGENGDGIFFFTPEGYYFEWNDTYLYTDHLVEIDDPIIKIEVAK